MALSEELNNISFVAFDTETTGKYPLDSEVCEIAGLKWKNGEIIGEFQSLVKPTHQMSQEVINIHHITNEMVIGAPPIAEVIGKFHEFIVGSVPLAHHAPFDMGFLCIEFERHNLALPKEPVLCTSLLSRALIKGTANHRLQTLAQHFAIDAGQAHRALDDARVCLEVGLKCFEAASEAQKVSLDDLIGVQGKNLQWADYAISPLAGHPVMGPVVRALNENLPLRITYKGGSRPGQSRQVFPMGLVRNSGNDFLVAQSEGDPIAKRYILSKITKSEL